MSEEQFWRSNPRIWKVWEEAHKQEMKQQNYLNYVAGLYTLSALNVALDHAFNKHAKSSYMEKPVQMFELTAQEKAEAEKKELEKFIGFADGFEKDVKRKFSK